VIVAGYANLVVDGEARIFPAQKRCREILADEALGQEELDKGSAEGFGELLGVVNGKEEESSVGGEASFQHQGVPVGVCPQEIAEWLK
jgi:hypothetical protein